MRGKKPLSEKQVVTLRKLVEGNELHELLLNLGVDLMLRASDLLDLKVSDVLNESGSVKKEVQVKMKKTKKTTLNLPLSKIPLQSSRNICLRGKERISSFSQLIITTQKTSFNLSVFANRQELVEDLGVEDVSEYSHSIRKTKSSVIYDRTKNVDAVRRLLGQSSVTATSAYLGISDESALDLARTINI